ncbi:hypothetical protein F0562_023782 [Nyssa sinensis]|uniref:NAC domain-containing protein n=1 Tax=Nyssa sinensis TaxID=561372 RepID=A0A5J5BIW9_9ASTE|nr:hypothetical protein F0562_023782 [Nyssa sinensis]
MSGILPSYDEDRNPGCVTMRKRKAVVFDFGPGLRFHPTDQELIQDYLLYKVMGKALVLEGMVTESDLYGDKEPWEIFDTSSTAAERIQYFFSVLKKKSAVGSRFCRTVGKGKGTWKGQDGGKQILDHQGRHIGCKRSFTYVDLNKNRAAAAGHSHDHHRWIMKEYSLDGINLNLSNGKDYVLCRIKYKNQGQKRPLIITTTHQSSSSSSSSTLDQEGIPLPLAITATTTILEIRHIAQQPRNLNEQLCFGDGDGDGDGDPHFPQEPTNVNIELFDLSCDYTIDDLLNAVSEEEFAEDKPWNTGCLAGEEEWRAFCAQQLTNNEQHFALPNPY